MQQQVLAQWIGIGHKKMYTLFFLFVIYLYLRNETNTTNNFTHSSFIHDNGDVVSYRRNLRSSTLPDSSPSLSWCTFFS